MEQFTASTTAAAARLMYCSQQWCTTPGPDETRYALNEPADMPHAGRDGYEDGTPSCARPASPTTTTSSRSSSMAHIKSPAPDDLSAIGSQKTGRLLLYTVGRLHPRGTLDTSFRRPAYLLSVYSTPCIILGNKSFTVMRIHRHYAIND